MNLGEGRVRAQEATVKRRLEDALHGVLEDGAVFLLGHPECLLSCLALGDVEGDADDPPEARPPRRATQN